MSDPTPITDSQRAANYRRQNGGGDRFTHRQARRRRHKVNRALRETP